MYKNNAQFGLESKICTRLLSGLSFGQSRSPARTVFIRDVVYHIMESQMEKDTILELIAKAKELTPVQLEPDLEPIEGFPDVPNWHDYEHKIWAIGANIRTIMFSNKSLRKDKDINDLVIYFCSNKNAKRGRQSFVLLLGYKHLAVYAPKLIKLIDDEYIDGHVIDTIYLMQSEGYEKEIRPFATHKITWIRKTALKYLEKYGTQQRTDLKNKVF